MSFPNVYYKRQTASPRACFICYQPTTTVLATAVTTDFLYTCDRHLTDPGFATQLGDNPDGINTTKAEPSAEEIAKVKEEWEERQKRKKEKEKAQAADKPEGDKDKPEEKKEEADSASPKAPGSAPVSPPTSGKSTPRHQRYALHRDIFAMRVAEHRKRKQVKQSQELAPRLPGAPRGSLGN
ncbi:DUF1742-domain-containing protein [Artomyces pyxidatus]|uniref:DUF1742-domain-containing protein n=1 Tax=Artomyces pyxidatus TaxID=48021 RepID=A0ACB8TKJ4_9AGAM|nr:DUF1742-domain-containing protein [Artomyces pyxidatus]